MQVTIGRESVYPTHFNLRSNNIGDDSDCHLEAGMFNSEYTPGSRFSPHRAHHSYRFVDSDCHGS